ncbi:DUF599 domain-containing protein [Aminobacter sp. BE322]|uniref:DUF599 domain-containing protein n=1 Tax=unclassified Aminobacter TaxID=2644704 RepID=UPI003D2190F6
MNGDSFSILGLMSTLDVAALAFFVAGWVFHAAAAEGYIVKRMSLTRAMNAQRAAWMATMARREVRIVDTSIMNGLQQGTAFFASSSLIAIGGCFALLGASDRVLAVLSDVPLAGDTARPLFEIKVFGLIVVLAYSFFKFGWAYRLFNYCSILIGAVPQLRAGGEPDDEIGLAVMRATRMNVLGGKHFNAGLRGVFFSLGYLGWFVDASVFFVTTMVLLAVLVRRQFFSEARRAVLLQGPGKGSSIRPDSQ